MVSLFDPALLRHTFIEVDYNNHPIGSPFYPPVITIRNAHDEKYTGRKRKKGVNLPSVSSVLWSRIADHQLFSAGSANGFVSIDHAFSAAQPFFIQGKC